MGVGKEEVCVLGRVCIAATKSEPGEGVRKQLVIFMDFFKHLARHVR